MPRTIRTTALLIPFLALAVGCDGKQSKEPPAAIVTIQQHGGAASAVSLDQVNYATAKVPDAISANAVAETRNGKHVLIVSLDEAGARLKLVTASAQHFVRQAKRGPRVRFDVTSTPLHGDVDLRFELRGAEWEVPRVEAFPVGGGAPAPNPKVRVSLRLQVSPDGTAISHGAGGGSWLLRPVAGANIDHPAITRGISGNGVLEPSSATVRVKSGSSYYVTLFARAEGQDVPGTNGYTGRIILRYDSLVVYHP